jgi:hypothetical protein
MSEEHCDKLYEVTSPGPCGQVLLQACLNLQSSCCVYKQCDVFSQVAAPLAYAAPAVTKLAAPALSYTAAYGSYGLGGLSYLHWATAQVMSWRHEEKQRC